MNRARPPRLPGRTPLILICLALLSILRPASAAAQASDTHDRWYVLRMQDQRAGWLHDQRRVKGERIVSSSEIYIELKRSEQSVVVKIESEFVETSDGKPVSMKLVQTLGSEPTTEDYTFARDGVDVVSTTAGARRTTRRELPTGQWLTPAASSRYIRARLEADAKEISVRSIDPSSGIDPVLSTNTVLERTTIEALGKTVPAVKWRTINDRHPDVAITEFVDEFGVPIRSETSFGALKIEIILADRELALSKIDAPELLVSTLVKPDRPIKRPRETVRATYKLSLKDGSVPKLPFGSAQSVSLNADGSLTVGVDPARAIAIPDHDHPTDPQSRPSTLITSDDPEVKRLVAKAVAGAGTEKPARAEAMRRFVHSYIRSKNLGVGFATAAEVARTRTGDCTEHAVLLAAMLRADGIPSRVVSGLIYADEFAGERDVFGYHMWTQASQGAGVWLNLDPTLPDNSRFDATHIALATADLSDGETTNALVSLVPLLGNLRITVEKVEY